MIYDRDERVVRVGGGVQNAKTLEQPGIDVGNVDKNTNEVDAPSAQNVSSMSSVSSASSVSSVSSVSSTPNASNASTSSPAPRSVPILARPHVGLFGGVNVGKSTLFNALLGQNTAIVSELPGTTTDPVLKAMELLPFGPIQLIDTAGLDDETALGAARGARTRAMLDRTDLALHCVSAVDFDESAVSEAARGYAREETPYLLVVTQCDRADGEALARIRAAHPEAAFVGAGDADALRALRARIAEALAREEAPEPSFLAGLLSAGATVLLVIVVDSASPKGRLILPQVQLIRDCVDNGITAIVTTLEALPAALARHSADAVITDSQVFGPVSRIVPPELPLTSFSLLLSRQKGSFAQLLSGAKRIDDLAAGARILVAEACTHNQTHEDIARVKIPRLLAAHTGKEFRYEYAAGPTFPEDLGAYDLVIHCGGCMINRKAMRARVNRCARQGVAVTNFGLALAKCGGIFKRCLSFFEGEGL